MRQQISDLAIVLSRSDYGEKDRILTVLTPNHGKLRAIAKSVRSSKSRLAGGIELFAENELALTKGRSNLYTVTFSRMKRYFGEIAKDLDKSMYAYDCLKLVNKLTPDEAGGEYYLLTANLLDALSKNKVSLTQIKIWYSLKILEELGASPNFTLDINGDELPENGTFEYDFDKHAFYQKTEGSYGADHIKILRYMQKIASPKEIKTESETVKSTERLVRLIYLGQIE